MEIRSLKDWCTALDEQSKVVGNYEKQLTAFYKNLKIVPDYDTPFMTGCYKKEKFIGGVLRGLPMNLLVSTILAAFIWLIAVIVKLVKSTDGFVVTAKTALGDCAKGAIIPFIVFIGFGILIKFLVYSSQKSSLSKMEKNLSRFLTTVPMNYRASDKMKTMAMVYFTKPSIQTNLILPCTDDYLRQAGHTTPYSSVMFDLPCNCPFLDMEDSEENGTAPVVDTKNLGKKRSGYLPKDIYTKVFEGAIPRLTGIPVPLTILLLNSLANCSTSPIPSRETKHSSME